MSAANGSIRKRGNRYYIRTRVRVIDPKTGESSWKQIEKKASTNRKQAGEELKELQGGVDAGEFVPTDATVLELGRKWLREHVQPELKPGAAANYKGTFYKHVVPTLGHLRVDECKPEIVRALLARKRAEGLSKETVAKIRRHMHAMFAFAQDERMVSVNPCAQPRKRGRKVSRKARGTKITPVQVAKLFEVASPRWRLFFAVALDTGMRRGELIGLRWGDVALHERLIYVRRSIGVYDDVEEIDRELDTKTDAGERLVPILDGAYAALEQLYRTAHDTSDDAPVFATVERKRARDENGKPVGEPLPVGRPLSPRMVTRVWRRYADRAGIPETVRLHDTRHTAMTSGIEQGVDPLILAAIGGYSKTSTMLDVYGHMMPDRVREAARKMQSVSAGALAHTFAHTLPTRDAEQSSDPDHAEDETPRNVGVAARS